MSLIIVDFIKIAFISTNCRYGPTLGRSDCGKYTGGTLIVVFIACMVGHVCETTENRVR
jgi:hypothetical protein